MMGPVDVLLLAAAFVLGVVIGSLLTAVVRVPVRYPLVELGTGVAFGAVALRLEQLGLRGALPAFCS